MAPAGWQADTYLMAPRRASGSESLSGYSVSHRAGVRGAKEKWREEKKEEIKALRLDVDRRRDSRKSARQMQKKKKWQRRREKSRIADIDRDNGERNGEKRRWRMWGCEASRSGEAVLRWTLTIWSGMQSTHQLQGSSPRSAALQNTARHPLPYSKNTPYTHAG